MARVFLTLWPSHGLVRKSRPRSPANPQLTALRPTEPRSGDKSQVASQARKIQAGSDPARADRTSRFFTGQPVGYLPGYVI